MAQQQWPEIDYWGTPTFYFYLNKKRIKQIVGWPPEGRESALVSILQALKVL